MTVDEIQRRIERFYAINMMREKSDKEPIKLPDFLRMTWWEIERLTEEARQIYNKGVNHD